MRPELGIFRCALSSDRTLPGLPESLNSQFSILNSAAAMDDWTFRSVSMAAAAPDVLKAILMIDDEILRGRAELTGRHRCIGCLAEVPREEYFANDFMCRECAAKSESYPLASTPGGASPVSGPTGGEGGGSS